jgi:hypothetical protein
VSPILKYLSNTIKNKPAYSMTGAKKRATVRTHAKNKNNKIEE